MGDEEVTTQDWVVGCSIRVLTKHTKEVRFSSRHCCCLPHRHPAVCLAYRHHPWQPKAAAGLSLGRSNTTTPLEG